MVQFVFYYIYSTYCIFLENLQIVFKVLQQSHHVHFKFNNYLVSLVSRVGSGSEKYNWASASRADAAGVDIPAQSDTGAFWYRTGSPYSGTGLDQFKYLHSFSFQYRTDWMPDSPAFTKIVRRWKGVRRRCPFCWWWRDTF
jgi:hypothetical protein